MLAHFAVGGIVALGVLLVALRGDGRHAGPLSAPQVFQLQDPIDGLCLGARGFVPCDASTLWTVGLGRARRSLVSFLHPSEDARCLDRVQTGAFDSKVRCTSCAAKNSRRWDVAPSHANGAMVMVTSEGAHCLARRSNFAWMQPCPFGHTPLALVESPLHEQGFFIATKGGAACFDGERFRACEPDDSTLYWAAAVRFDGRRGVSATRAALAPTTPTCTRLAQTQTLSHARNARRDTSASSRCTRGGKRPGRGAFPTSRAIAAHRQRSPTAAPRGRSVGR